VLDGEVVLPVVCEALVELRLLLLGDVGGLALPDGLVLVDLLVLVVHLLDLLFLLLVFFVNFFLKILNGAYTKQKTHSACETAYGVTEHGHDPHGQSPDQGRRLYLAFKPALEVVAAYPTHLEHGALVVLRDGLGVLPAHL